MLPVDAAAMGGAAPCASALELACGWAEPTKSGRRCMGSVWRVARRVGGREPHLEVVLGERHDDLAAAQHGRRVADRAVGGRARVQHPQRAPRSAAVAARLHHAVGLSVVGARALAAFGERQETGARERRQVWDLDAEVAALALREHVDDGVYRRTESEGE